MADWPGLNWPKCSLVSSLSEQEQCLRSSGRKQVSGTSSRSEDGGGAHGQEGRGKWASGKGVEQPRAGQPCRGTSWELGPGSSVSCDLPSPFTQQLGFCGDERRHSGRLDLRSFGNRAAGAALTSTCSQIEGTRGVHLPQLPSSKEPEVKGPQSQPQTP